MWNETEIYFFHFKAEINTLLSRSFVFFEFDLVLKFFSSSFCFCVKTVHSIRHLMRKGLEIHAFFFFSSFCKERKKIVSRKNISLFSMLKIIITASFLVVLMNILILFKKNRIISYISHYERN